MSEIPLAHMPSNHLSPTHIYCFICDKITVVQIDATDSESICGKFMGRDLVCSRCKLIIATLYKERS